MYWKIFESFLSKSGELIADKAHNKLKVVDLKMLLTNLKLLSEKEDDVDQQIKHAERLGRKKRKLEVEVWLEEVKSIKNEVDELKAQMEAEGFLKRFMHGGKIEQLNQQVVKLVEQSQNFGELVIDRLGTRGETLPTGRMVGNGYEINLKKILTHMENEEVRRIGIHGMGGVGKTTLAKAIYNKLLEVSPGRVFWVTVSQEFTIKSLQENIGYRLDVSLSDENNEDMRAGILSRALCDMKNVVLILDDVWRYIDLSKVVGCAFSEECCKLIMTSRSLDVCRQIVCQEVIGVEILGEDEAWNLFYQTFTHGKKIDLTHQVEKTAKSMAKCCDGLPLAIISLAASMRGQTAIHTWRNALEKLQKSFAEQDGMREGRVFEVLKYSFDQLNDNSGSQSKDFNSLQLCFLYFSLYPEDEEVRRDELIREFISEGLVDTKKMRRAQYDEGQVIIDKLVNVCLLERVVKYDDVEFVKIHDLLRAMALKIVGGKYLVKAGERSVREIPKEDEWTEDVEKVSLMRTDIWRIENGTSPNSPNLSTLILRLSVFGFIPDSFFSKMQGLCHLDLCHTSIRVLPNSLSNLKNLQSLLLAYCRHLEYVPYLGNLKALRELDLSGTPIKETPEGLDKLLNLKFLSLEKASKLGALPKGVLPKLVNLQCLRLPFHLKAVDMEEMENLTQLEVFRGRVKNERDFNCFLASREHVVSFYDVRVGVRGAVGLDCGHLRIRNYGGMSKCLWDDFSRPRNLRKLEIEDCRGTEWIWRSEQLVSAPHELESPISSLQELEMDSVYDLKGLIDTPTPGPALPQGVFSSLTTLFISDCNKMRKLGLPAWGFPNLETILIEFCEEIQEIFGRGSVSVTLPKLKQLSLCHLLRLESVCEAAMICNSIQDITIRKCPRLVNRLPVHLDVPLQPTLTSVAVDREWWESLEWDNPHQLPHLLQSSLCRLHLSRRKFRILTPGSDL